MLAALLPLPAGPALAADGPFDLGGRANIVGGSGKPANDILGLGLFGHYRFNDRWSAGFALDHSPEFDVERTAALVGLRQDPGVSDIDSTATSIEVRAWVERLYGGLGDRWQLFWSVGAGVAVVDVDDVAGPLADGGRFDVATDASTELVLALSAGVRRWLGATWGLEAALRGDEHFASWKYRDRNSGATGTSGDYFVRGVSFGVLRRF